MSDRAPRTSHAGGGAGRRDGGTTTLPPDTRSPTGARIDDHARKHYLDAPPRVSETPAAAHVNGSGTRVDPKDPAGTLLNAAACALFSMTVFISAALLLMVQPMFAKMALPLLGGTPAVWNTCMVFFQAVLLVGYGYAHVAPAALGVRRQAALHLALALITLVLVPVAIPEGWSPTEQQSPFMWLLGLLVVALGLPFLVVSTTAPLVQK